MPTARELLEQADALMRRNRSRGHGRHSGPDRFDSGVPPGRARAALKSRAAGVARAGYDPDADRTRAAGRRHLPRRRPRGSRGGRALRLAAARRRRALGHWRGARLDRDRPRGRARRRRSRSTSCRRPTVEEALRRGARAERGSQCCACRTSRPSSGCADEELAPRAPEIVRASARIGRDARGRRRRSTWRRSTKAAVDVGRSTPRWMQPIDTETTEEIAPRSPLPRPEPPAASHRRARSRSQPSRR